MTTSIVQFARRLRSSRATSKQADSKLSRSYWPLMLLGRLSVVRPLYRITRIASF